MARLLALLATGIVLLSGGSPYVSAGISLKYGEGFLPGSELRAASSTPYLYRENFLMVTAGYGDFSFWSDFEFSSPPQIGPDHAGLRKFRLTWEGKQYTASVGDLYGQIGRGLGLNMWENQAIDWDSSLRGFRMEVKPLRGFSLDLLAGRANSGRYLPQGPGVNPRKRDFSDDATVGAVTLTRENLFPGLRLGGYFVRVNASNPWFSKVRSVSGHYEVMDSMNVETRSNIPGFFSEYFGTNYDLYVEFMVRGHEISLADSLYSSALVKSLHYDKRRMGSGGYASFSLYPGRWGITLEYKNYALDYSNPDKRLNLPLRLGRRSIVQSPPTAFREHTSTLLSRTPHVMDFEDEVGIQIEFNYRMSPDLFLIFNTAHSSRHSAHARIIRPDFSTEWKMTTIPNVLWMDAGEKFFPYREFYLEVDYYVDDLELDIRGMVASTSEVIAYDESLTERAGASGWLSRHAKYAISWERRDLVSTPFEFSFSLPANWGLDIRWEHQLEKSNLKTFLAFEDRESGHVDSVVTDRTTKVPFYYRYVAVTLGKPSRFSVGFVYDHASRVKNDQPQNVDPENDSWLEEILRN
ncbi:MAG: DUF6029 family protein, partial [Candidatus Neomarinimicrobiota bacterium]